MASRPITDYVGRWNATLARKEWRRSGHSLLVVSGGIVTITPLTAVLSALPNPATVGATVTLTADVSGGLAPYTYAWTPPTGVTLTGTGNTTTFTAPTTSTNLTFRVLATDSQPVPFTQEATVSVTVGTSTAGVSLFAGHIPNRVLVGMATPSGGARPVWTEAQTQIGQSIYEARRFTSSTWDSGQADSALAEADSAGSYGVIEFNYANQAGFPLGTFDADLIALCDYAKTRAAAGKAPFAVVINHEPEPASDSEITDWANMHIYCAWFFGGRRGGTPTSTYVAANDITTGAAGTTQCMAWAPCGNGFWWRTNAIWSAANSRADRAFPTALINALKVNKGIILNDFYDANYTNQTAALTDVSQRATVSGVRTSARITQYMLWARARGATCASGCGEFGVVHDTEMTATWKVMRENRDLWAISNYFNSNNNSDHEWRVVPASYPAYNGTNSKGLVDFGGDAQSAGRLAAFKTMLTESTSPLYTTAP